MQREVPRPPSRGGWRGTKRKPDVVKSCVTPITHTLLHDLPSPPSGAFPAVKLRALLASDVPPPIPDPAKPLIPVRPAAPSPAAPIADPVALVLSSRFTVWRAVVEPPVRPPAAAPAAHARTVGQVGLNAMALNCRKACRLARDAMFYFYFFFVLSLPLSLSLSDVRHGDARVPLC